MRWSHLRAVLWMRWRILVNRIQRAGRGSKVLASVLILVGAAISAGLFVLALTLGLEALPEAGPMPVMMTWVGLALAFLFFWTIGLVTDLQRSDAMSFDNLLHLPVSLGWVFLYNYLSSWVSISVALFLPAMVGLCIAMVIVDGPLMLLGFPLIAGFFGMVTALTYQLRGWLARLMKDKRRGRSIVAAITVGFILLLQVPNLINVGLSRTHRAERELARRELEAAKSEGGESAAEALAHLKEERAAELAAMDRNVSLAARIVPPGWLPYGMRATLERRWSIGLLCALGMGAIAAWSLRRSYRTTLAGVVGGGSERRAARAKPERVGRTAASAERPTLLVERRLPFAGETETGVALAALRSLLRAPEARMVLLSPLILLGLFGFMLATNPARGSMKPFAPMMNLGAITLGLLSINQLIQNQFGLDREGFRAYVLSPAPRYRILLGKNMATAPLALGVGLVALIGLQFLVSAGLVHFLGACLQLVSAYLLLCLVGNGISILGPMRLREHGLKAADAKLKTIVWQLVSLVLVPLAFSPLLIPSAIEFLLRRQAWAQAIPLFLILHAIELAAVFGVYRWIVRRQGELLQEREQHVLDVLTHD